VTLDRPVGQRQQEVGAAGVDAVPKKIALLLRPVCTHHDFLGVSSPSCLSSSLALHFFRLFFFCPPPCSPG
jgi:hypothetical protein